MAQQKKPLWKLCDEWDWAAVQQRIRDKDVGDINEKDKWVSFYATPATIMRVSRVKKVLKIQARDMKRTIQSICKTRELNQRLGSWFLWG